MSEATARAEAELLFRSRDDPAAFRAFYDQWSAAVLAYFQRRVHDPDLALELTAETFAVAFEKRARFRWMGKSPAAWLFGIAKRILFRHLRHQDVDHRATQRLGMQVPETDPDSYGRIEELMDGERLRALVLEALEQCRPADREVLELHIIDERPYPEVAELLGCTVNNARVKVHRALARIEAHLELLDQDTPQRRVPIRERPPAAATDGTAPLDGAPPDLHGVAPDGAPSDHPTAAVAGPLPGVLPHDHTNASAKEPCHEPQPA